MKQVDERGVVFFTNTNSRKGRELHANPRAALTFYWSVLGKQVRFEGRVRPVSRAEADAYWRTRPRASQLAAAASRQSASLSSRAALMDRYRDLEERYRGVEVPRPPQWSGFRLVPDAIEFWIHAEHRLHRRELFVRRAGRWRSTLLQP
jgi:pyridoxamine 5'-phosphate oxidase